MERLFSSFLRCVQYFSMQYRCGDDVFNMFLVAAQEISCGEGAWRWCPTPCIPQIWNERRPFGEYWEILGLVWRVPGKIQLLFTDMLAGWKKRSWKSGRKRPTTHGHQMIDRLEWFLLLIQWGMIQFHAKFAMNMLMISLEDSSHLMHFSPSWMTIMNKRRKIPTISSFHSFKVF